MADLVRVKREPYERHDPETGERTGQTVDSRLIERSKYEANKKSDDNPDGYELWTEPAPAKKAAAKK